mgnify:CR=1 FL=1
MNKRVTGLKTLGAAITVIACAGSANALPTLQLTIEDGGYNTASQTTYATTNPFTLYALLTAPQLTGNCNQACVDAVLNDTYYISAAVVPKTTSPSTLGSFIFGSYPQVNVTSGMVYGSPPLETVTSLLGQDPGDLAPHGIFETYFAEFSFKFDKNVSTTPFNVQPDSNPLNGSPDDPLVDNDGGLYFVPFTIDIANLDPNTAIHFDLYNSSVKACTNGNCVAGDIDVDDFAPFSHDAQTGSSSSGGNPGDGQIPEPGMLGLLGAGLMAQAWVLRRRRQQRR